MRDLLIYGQAITTPVFFLITLLVLWRILRLLDAAMAVLVHVKRQIEILGRGGLPEGIEPSPRVREADASLRSTKEGSDESDADHRG